MRLRPDDRLLEIGVGTGRIARPLLARGYHLTGVDVSREMMARLRAQLPPESPRPDLLQGDATRLALADACFEVVISVHIFHLIPAWPQALSEVRRVLAPGGALLQGYNHRSERTPAARLRDQWGQITAEYGAQGVHAGLRDFAELQACPGRDGRQPGAMDRGRVVLGAHDQRANCHARAAHLVLNLGSPGGHLFRVRRTLARLGCKAVRRPGSATQHATALHLGAVPLRRLIAGSNPPLSRRTA